MNHFSFCSLQIFNCALELLSFPYKIKYTNFGKIINFYVCFWIFNYTCTLKVPISSDLQIFIFSVLLKKPNTFSKNGYINYTDKYTKIFISIRNILEGIRWYGFKIWCRQMNVEIFIFPKHFIKYCHIINVTYVRNVYNKSTITPLPNEYREKNYFYCRMMLKISANFLVPHTSFLYF